MKSLKSELLFVLELWKANLASAMEYRASFVSQVLGMILNNSIFFVFWLLFFDRFRMVKGWQMGDMLLLFSIVTTGFGLAVALFGNSDRIAELAASGRLDYYLVLPRNTLLHVLASRSVISGWGDLVFGILIFSISGYTKLPQVLIWAGASICSGTVITCSFAIFGSLTFWLGNASQLAQQARNALLLLSCYPDNIFQGGIRYIMLTIIPAALVGGVPYAIVKTLNWRALLLLMVTAVFFVLILIAVFYRGLKNYESGSAVNVNM